MDEVLLREAIEKLKGTEIAEATILHTERQRQRVKDLTSELANPFRFFSDVSLRMQTNFFGIVFNQDAILSAPDYSFLGIDRTFSFLGWNRIFIFYSMINCVYSEE